MHQSFLSNRTNAPRSGQIHAHGPCFHSRYPRLQQRIFHALQPPHGMECLLLQRRTARHRQAPLRQSHLFQGGNGKLRRFPHRQLQKTGLSCTSAQPRPYSQSTGYAVLHGYDASFRHDPALLFLYRRGRVGH
ncbi:hypothetical protein EAJ17_11330, partial [Akkermansia sp. aa_0143]